MNATTADALNDLAQQTDAEGQTPGQERDMSRYAKVDYQLHLTVARASGVGRFVDDLEKLHLHAMVWRNAIDTRQQPQTTRASLVEALVSGDVDKAEKAMREHITVATDTQLHALRIGGLR